MSECPMRVLGSAEDCESEFAAKSTIPLATVPSLTNSKTPHSEVAASKPIFGERVRSNASCTPPHHLLDSRPSSLRSPSSASSPIRTHRRSRLQRRRYPRSTAAEEPKGHDFAHDLGRDGVTRTVSSQSKTTWCSLDITPSWQCSPPPSAAGKRW